jgi:uracil-DNA glycosylase
MMTDPRDKRLTQLKEKIEATIPNAWVFPVDSALPSVRGFLGRGPIMCVAERPSTGKKFPDASVRRLYGLLDKLGIADSHLTDVIKSRGKVGEPYPDDMRVEKEVFDEEIDIVRPCCIVAFGQKVFDLLQFTLADSRIKVYRAHHYAYARRGADAAEAFERTFREAIGKCRQLNR